MGLVYPIQTAFTSGEVSPLLAARIDFAKYKTGLETCTNAILHPQGPVTGRPGTAFVNTVKYQNRVTRLIPFEFSTTQAYVIEAGHLYFRFYFDSGIVLDRIRAEPLVIYGPRTQRVGYIEQLNPRARIAQVARQVSRSSTALTTWIGWKGGSITEVTTPYTEEELSVLKYAQSADVLYLAHPNYPPAKLSRLGHDLWTYTPIDFYDGPYLNENEDTDHSLTLSGGSYNDGDTLTLTATGVQNAPFLPGHVGSIWQVRINGSPPTTAFVKVTAYVSPTVVTVVAKEDVDVSLQAVATSLWSEGAWSEVRGYPKAVTIFEQRLIWSSSEYQPQTEWGSVSDDYENMSPGLQDADNAFTYTHGSNQVNVTRWLVGSKSLYIGTVGGEFTMDGGPDNPLTPTSVRAKHQSRHGSNVVQALAVYSDVIFIQRSGRKVRRFVRNIDPTIPSAGEVTDLSLLSEHITLTGIRDMQYEQEPYSTLWMTRVDGTLVGLTYWPDQEVLGWHKHTTSGGLFEYLATIPHPDGTKDQTWVVVKRGSNRYIEVLDYSRKTDSSLAYNGAATSSFGGLTHLNGQTVAVIGDGAPRDSKVVAAGAVTVSGSAATTGEVGLAFTSTVKLLRPLYQDNRGYVYGRNQRWGQVWLMLKDTQGLHVNGDFIPAAELGDDMDEATPTFSGMKKVIVEGWDESGQLTIEQRQPVSWTLLAVLGRLQAGE